MEARSAFCPPCVHRGSPRTDRLRSAGRSRCAQADAVGGGPECPERDPRRRMEGGSGDHARRPRMAGGDAKARLYRFRPLLLRTALSRLFRRSGRGRPPPSQGNLLRDGGQPLQFVGPADRGALRGRRSRREKGVPARRHRSRSGQPEHPRVCPVAPAAVIRALGETELYSRRQSGALAQMVVPFSHGSARRADPVVGSVYGSGAAAHGAVSRIDRRDVRALHGSRRRLVVPHLYGCRRIRVRTAVVAADARHRLSGARGLHRRGPAERSRRARGRQISNLPIRTVQSTRRCGGTQRPSTALMAGDRRPSWCCGRSPASETTITSSTGC